MNIHNFKKMKKLICNKLYYSFWIITYIVYALTFIVTFMNKINRIYKRK